MIKKNMVVRLEHKKLGKYIGIALGRQDDDGMEIFYNIRNECKFAVNVNLISKDDILIQDITKYENKIIQ